MLPGGHAVSISSAEQLEGKTFNLVLAAIVVDTLRGLTLPELVAEIRNKLESSSTAASEFDLRLAEAGYVERPEYKMLYFSVQNELYFDVDETFPRITTAQLPRGISQVTYNLDLRYCGNPSKDYVYGA
jgi:hypothetical protein